VGVERAEARRLKVEPISVSLMPNSSTSFHYVPLVLRPERRGADVEISRANLVPSALLFFLKI
jgi:hypothetical protein